jgi:hypothetical protein
MHTIVQAITDSLYSFWQWLLTADQQTIVTMLLIVAMSTVVSYVLQFFKRRYNIDLLAKGKVFIYSLLTMFSSLAAIADWYILSMPANFAQHFLIFGFSTYTIATWVHRIHVSPMYAKITGAITQFFEDVQAVRAAKQAAANSAATPAYLEPETPTKPFEG